MKILMVVVAVLVSFNAFADFGESGPGVIARYENSCGNVFCPGVGTVIEINDQGAVLAKSAGTNGSWLKVADLGIQSTIPSTGEKAKIVLRGLKWQIDGMRNGKLVTADHPGQCGDAPDFSAKHYTEKLQVRNYVFGVFTAYETKECQKYYVKGDFPVSLVQLISGLARFSQ